MATKRLWRWRGIDVQGAPCQGMLWQTKRLEVLQHLQQQRVIPLAVRRCAVKQSLWHPRYSCETIRQLASLLQAGLPLAEGLSLLAQSSRMPSGRRCLRRWAASWPRAWRSLPRWRSGPRLFRHYIWR